VKEGVTEGETDRDCVAVKDVELLVVAEGDVLLVNDAEVLTDRVALPDADTLPLPLTVAVAERDGVSDAVMDVDKVADGETVVETLLDGETEPEFRAQPWGPTQREQLSPELPGSCQMSK